jgi:hypothetical protein
MADGIRTENELERWIVSAPRWQTGVEWGKPRPGHPEGTVGAHVRDVLANVDRLGLGPEERRRLRLVALVHDTFKHEVDPGRPRTGDNHHAAIARRFLARYTDDSAALDITELHDEAYNAWQIAGRDGDPARAEARARRLIARLGTRLPLYLAFYRADNATGDKRREPLEWFEALCAATAG